MEEKESLSPLGQRLPLKKQIREILKDHTTGMDSLLDSVDGLNEDSQELWKESNYQSETISTVGEDVEKLKKFRDDITTKLNTKLSEINPEATANKVVETRLVQVNDSINEVKTLVNHAMKLASDASSKTGMT